MPSAILAELKQTRPFRTPEEELGVSIARTAATVEHRMAEMLRDHGITPTQYNVLRILRGAGNEGLCRNEVRDRLVAPVPDATRLLDRMEEMDLVSRHRDTPDRRFVTSRITERGRALVDSLDRPVTAMRRAQFGHLGLAKLKTLIDLLAQARLGGKAVS
jgi:DNA-binding MarR family transcriptional regulator